MRSRHVLPIVAVAFVASLGACSEGGSIGPGLAVSRIGASDLRSYRVGIGDKIRLTVFGEADLSGTFDVNAQGQIGLPLAGEIKVAGLDVNGVRDAIARRLSEGYLKSPRITVEIASYRPIYVHGEVRTGGEFAYKVGTRFRDVIAVAGGYTYRANSGYVVLSRDGAAREVRVPMPSDMLVMPGDNIRVPERFF